MVRRRSTVRFRNGAPARGHFSFIWSIERRAARGRVLPPMHASSAPCGCSGWFCLVFPAEGFLPFGRRSVVRWAGIPPVSVLAGLPGWVRVECFVELVRILGSARLVAVHRVAAASGAWAGLPGVCPVQPCWDGRRRGRLPREESADRRFYAQGDQLRVVHRHAQIIQFCDASSLNGKS
jgi:hypothetical protein